MSSAETIDPPEKITAVDIRPLQPTDIPALRPILETCIRYKREIIRDEVEETLKATEESANGQGGRTYFVAEDANDGVVGIMGMREPEERMLAFKVTESPVEIINAFVSPAHRRTGIGRALVARIENEARQKGCTELVLNSGPRYQFTGWAAWNKIFGDPVTIAKDYYGEGWSAPVWRKLL